jgi:type VI secretion system secreted protein Hcp
MPSPAYATITGASQGNISDNVNTADSIGNSYQEGHTNEMLILEFHSHVTIPRDPQSGQPTGLRIHQPAEIITCFSKASPLLWGALCAGEILQITLAYHWTAMTGAQEQYFKIQYTDALLVEGKAYIPQVLDEKFKNYPHCESWMFTYRKVEWTHVKAGTSGSDDWRAPK